MLSLQIDEFIFNLLIWPLIFSHRFEINKPYIYFILLRKKNRNFFLFLKKVMLNPTKM